MWYNIITVKDRSPKMKGIGNMLKNLIFLYAVNGDILATIEDKEDYDEILPQLNEEQQKELFASMEDSIQCYEGGEDVKVNADNFSDVMCEWGATISAYEDDEDDEDKEVVFEYFKEEYEIPDDADYYTIQRIVDGFGNDSYVMFSTAFKSEALEYIKANGLENKNIIPQYYNTRFNNIDDFDY